MPDKAIEKYPFMTPDSLRQFLKLNKNMYDLHTDRNYGVDDTGGLKYTGTVENFGSEILIESNKLKLNKPPIEELNINDSLNFYFDLKFANTINDYSDFFIYQNENKYSKQNMVCGLLRKDRLISNYTYELIYSDIQLVYSLNSYSSSDAEVVRMAYFKTITPPTLRITDDNSNVTNIVLDVNDGSDVDTNYYFPINLMTFDLLGLTYPIDAFITQIANAGTFTINITNGFDIPYIWFCVDRFKKLPQFELINNYGVNHRTLLSVGMDGHNRMHLYPSCDTQPCVPTTAYDEYEGRWYLKAYGDFIIDIPYGSDKAIIIGDIDYIEYMYANTVYPAEPYYNQKITYNSSLYKIKVNNDIRWFYRTPEEGEYDYDPTREKQLIYVYLPLSEFDDNAPTNFIINNTVTLKHAFDVKLDDREFIDYYENEMNHMTAGIHIDYTTDYSENGVKKLRGVVHDMGEFDGLPQYFKEWMPETHRVHAELYAIRDNIINNNNPMNRQTAGIIVDSGVPQIDIETISDDMEVSIAYIGDGIFDTIRESESPINYLSDLGYHDDTTFAYTGISTYANDQKFIYHGNGVFSLGFQGFDPNLEMGRVYGITNDPIDYENNGLTENRTARTVARICDIPTSYIQLINIKNYSPTYALDPYYVRQEASWTPEQEELLWNLRNPRLVCYNNKRIFSVDDNLDTLIPLSYLRDNYSSKTNFGRTLDMSHPETSTDFRFSVYYPGTGYNSNNEFNAIIGGINFRGKVNGTGPDGTVLDVKMYDTTYTDVYIGNLAPNPMICKTTAISGTGSGLLLKLMVDPIVWEDLNIKTGDIFDDIYALKLDDINRIWVYRYNSELETWYRDCILTGEEITYNYYDEEIPINKFKPKYRKLRDVYLYNFFLSGFNTYSGLPSTTTDVYENAVPGSTDITSDLSEYINHYNHDESVYVITHNTNIDHNLTEIHTNSASDYDIFDQDRKLLPQYHLANTFFSYTPEVKLTCDMFNQVDLIRQPDVYIYSILKDKKYIYENAVYNEFCIDSISPYTLKDVLTAEYFNGNNTLKWNVYTFTFTNDIKVIDNRINELNEMDRSELINIISELYPESEPIKVEGSINQFTKENLVAYIIEHEKRDRSGIKLFRNNGENYLNGEQYKGGYIKIQNVYDKYLSTISGDKLLSKPTSVFKLDNFNTDNIHSFRMYDDLGNDVSEYSILLIDNKLYAFISNDWVVIQTKGVDI